MKKVSKILLLLVISLIVIISMSFSKTYADTQDLDGYEEIEDEYEEIEEEQPVEEKKEEKTEPVVEQKTEEKKEEKSEPIVEDKKEETTNKAQTATTETPQTGVFTNPILIVSFVGAAVLLVISINRSKKYKF